MDVPSILLYGNITTLCQVRLATPLAPCLRGNSNSWPQHTPISFPYTVKLETITPTITLQECTCNPNIKAWAEHESYPFTAPNWSREYNIIVVQQAIRHDDYSPGPQLEADRERVWVWSEESMRVAGTPPTIWPGKQKTWMFDNITRCTWCKNKRVRPPLGTTYGLLCIHWACIHSHIQPIQCTCTCTVLFCGSDNVVGLYNFYLFRGHFVHAQTTCCHA